MQTIKVMVNPLSTKTCDLILGGGINGKDLTRVYYGIIKQVFGRNHFVSKRAASVALAKWSVTSEVFPVSWESTHSSPRPLGLQPGTVAVCWEVHQGLQATPQPGSRRPTSTVLGARKLSISV